MLRDKAHFRADFEPTERAADDAVAVKIDLLARRSEDEAAVPLGQQAYDPPVIGYRMLLDRTAAAARVIFEQTAGGVEGVTDGNMRILVRVVRTRITADDDLGTGDGEIDANLE